MASSRSGCSPLPSGHRPCAAFHAWWLDHVALGARMPGLRGYRVNLVKDVRGAGFSADVVRRELKAVTREEVPEAEMESE